MTNQNKQKILGIDPGTVVTGYGIISFENNLYTPIDYGCIKPPKNFLLTDRYHIIFQSLVKIIKTFAPDSIAVETQFIHKNIQSAIKLSMARAVAIIAAKQYNLPIYEYSPRKAKQAVVGKGSASKKQVQVMVQKLLNLKQAPYPEDAADALALAICHANSIRYKQMIGAKI